MRFKNTSKNIHAQTLYDYSSSLMREETVSFLLDYAAKARQKRDEYTKKMRRYYDGKHDIHLQSESFAAENSLPFIPCQSTDGYIHVETQISANVPDFEFSPRDKGDYGKAKQREKIVKFICDNNDLSYKNARNERSLCIDGSAVWKVAWDSSAFYGEDGGDVTVLCPKSGEIYPDPSATDVDSCEYIGYVYRMHKQKAARIFGKDLKRLSLSIDDCTENTAGVILESDLYGGEDETVSITEWWFRQTSDGRCDIYDGDRKLHYEWKAGDIACSILMGSKEIRYIPRYWNKTGFKDFPFVIYSKIPDDKSIWGKSELEQIIPLIDAKDRELCYAQLNAAFNSNDIILMEENALSDGENLDNSPGAVWKVRPGMMGKVARLGNISNAESSLYNGASFWQSLIESTTGNFDVNQGKEPTSVTTATGIALLNERAESRRSLKNIDRNAAFSRLYRLIDKTALEYYGDGRIVRMGAAEGEDFVYSYGGFIERTRKTKYIPELDVTVHTGSSTQHSRAFTISALEKLMTMNIDKDNYRFVKAYVESVAIPESANICAYLEEKFGDGENNTQDGDIKRIENMIAYLMSEGEKADE